MVGLSASNRNNGQQTARRHGQANGATQTPPETTTPSSSQNAATQPTASQAAAAQATNPQTTVAPSVLDSLALNQDQQNMLDALRKAFQGDLNQEVVAHTNILERLAKSHTVVTDLSKHTDGDPVVFKSNVTKRSLSVTKDNIEFVGKKGILGNTKGFSYAAALEMAEFASLDVDMRAGVTLTGTAYEKALLERAIVEVNKSLPEGQKIDVNNPQKTWLRGGYLNTEKDAKAYAKKNSTDFKRETPLRVTGAQPAPAAASAAVNLKDSDYALLVDHVKATGTAAKTDIRDFFKDNSIGKGNLAETVKAAATLLEREDFVSAVPHGTGTKLVVDLSSFASAAAGAPQPTTPAAQAQQAGNVVSRALSSLRSAMPSFGQNRGSSPTGGTAPA